MILSKLTVSRKLLASSLIFTLPIAVMAFFIVSGLRYDEVFTAKEAYGTSYLSPLIRLLAAMPAYGRALSTDVSLSSSESSKIDKAFDTLIQEQARYGEILKVTEQGLALRQRERIAPDKLLTRWQEIKKAGPRASSSDLTSLYADVRELIVHVGDSSNLILDPDLDTYYLMDVCLLAIPDSMGRLNTELNALVEGKSVSPVFRTLNSDIDRARIVSSSETALAEDPNFVGIDAALQEDLPPALKSFMTASEALDSQSEAGYARALLRCLDATVAYWDVGAGALERMLVKRARGHRMKLYFSISSALLAAAIAYLVVLAIARNLLSQIGGVRQAVSAMAKKDLRAISAPQSKDELGATAADMALLARELNTSLRSFYTAVRTLENSSVNMSSSSEDLMKSSGDLAASIEQISAALEQSFSTMGSIRSSVERQFEAIGRTAGSLDQSSQGLVGVVSAMTKLRGLAKDGGVASRDGRSAIEAMIEEAHKLGGYAVSLAERIDRIAASAESIGGVVDTISDIAERTQLLAMNASIEAAHAGAAGKGFAVVAQAVRGLADSTTQALDSIRARIDAIGGAVKEAAEASGQMSSLSSDVSMRTASAESALHRIGDSVDVMEREIGALGERLGTYEDLMSSSLADARSLKDFSEAIRVAVEEQNAGSQEIMKAVLELRNTSSKNAASSQSLAEVSTTLKDESRVLDGIIGDFILEDEKGGGRPLPRSV